MCGDVPEVGSVAPLPLVLVHIVVGYILWLIQNPRRSMRHTISPRIQSREGKYSDTLTCALALELVHVH